jgi:hypothetical protein
MKQTRVKLIAQRFASPLAPRKQDPLADLLVESIELVHGCNNAGER